jgi:hypothetical protein
VAAGNSIYQVAGDTANDSQAVEPALVLQTDGAEFCGVDVAPAAYGGDLFVINRTGNSLLRLARNSDDSILLFASSGSILAGGNNTFPQGVWYEGISQKVKLWGPTFGAFAHNSFIFSNAGRGGRLGKVLMLTDIYPMAGLLMPALCNIADAFGLTEREADHAYNWTHASSMLAAARDVFDSIEEDNFRINHAPRGAEGPAGNFSNVCRRSLRQLAQLLQNEHTSLVALGVPQRVFDVLSPRSLLTLTVENFFTKMRAHWQNPYSLQYQSNHALACLLHSFQSRGASGFVYFTGQRRAACAITLMLSRH